MTNKWAETNDKKSFYIVNDISCRKINLKDQTKATFSYASVHNEYVQVNMHFPSSVNSISSLQLNWIGKPLDIIDVKTKKQALTYKKKLMIGRITENLKTEDLRKQKL